MDWSTFKKCNSYILLLLSKPTLLPGTCTKFPYVIVVSGAFSTHSKALDQHGKGYLLITPAEFIV